MSGILIGVPGLVKRILERLRTWQVPALPLRSNATDLLVPADDNLAVACSHYHRVSTLGTSYTQIGYAGKGYVDFAVCTGENSSIGDGIGMTVTVELLIDFVVVATDVFTVHDAYKNSSPERMGVGVLMPAGHWSNHSSVPLEFKANAEIRCKGSRSVKPVTVKLFMNVVPFA